MKTFFDDHNAIPLYPRLTAARKRHWLARILGIGKSQLPPVDAITLDSPKLVHTSRCVDLERPFHVSLSVWPYPEHPETVELNLRLRQSSATLEMRTVWPASRQAVGERKRGYQHFCAPTLFAELWQVLARYSEIHNSPWDATALDLPDDPRELAGLSSHNTLHACVSCESLNVLVTGAEIYTCKDCGYVGGEGLARRVEMEREAALEQLSPEERRKRGLSELQSSAHMLSATIGDLNQLRNMTSDSNDELRQEIGFRVLQDLYETLQGLRVAHKLLELPELEPIIAAVHEASERQPSALGGCYQTVFNAQVELNRLARTHV